MRLRTQTFLLFLHGGCQVVELRPAGIVRLEPGRLIPKLFRNGRKPVGIRGLALGKICLCGLVVCHRVLFRRKGGLRGLKRRFVMLLVGRGKLLSHDLLDVYLGLFPILGLEKPCPLGIRLLRKIVVPCNTFIEIGIHARPQRIRRCLSS